MEKIVLFFGGCALLILFALIMSIPTMLLWNWIVPDITKEAVKSITIWQALGLNCLCGILFKGSCTCNNKEE